ncbi:putative cytosolic iron-sulfur protein assembly protein 1 [Scheffersomyces xylosifermentans]|uniref:putative cytosolic iron-sulfur protein assembly protein 1 n=1 Tax=Scheffersomyces xylosifermentans TaxID=1304137 RepID=UPI00315D46F1
MVQLIKSIKAHSDKAWSVSAHKTLPLLATASTDKTSKIYKLSALQNFPQVSELEDTHKRSIRSVAFKPPLPGAESNFLDLPALAAGSFDSTISVWGIDEPETEIDDEEVLANATEILSSPNNEWNLMAIIEGHENEIKAVDWNHTGSLLASCSRDKTVWIWETDPETLEEFECISVLNDHQHDIKHVTWHPHQNLLASSSYDDTIRLYKQDIDDDDWSCVGVLNGHEGTVWCSQFEDNKSVHAASSNKIRLVSASDDLTVRIWSSVSDEVERDSNAEYIPSSIKHTSEMVWEQESVLPAAHKYPVYSVSWSSKTGKIASVGSDGKIVIYKEIKGDNDERKWVIDSQKESAHGVHEINSVIWASLDDDSEVLITAGDDGHVNIWKE